MDASTTDSPFAVDWAIAAPLRTGGEPEVLDLRRAPRRPAPHAHCAACQGRGIETIVTPNGPTYHHCRDCDRLWRLQENGGVYLVPGATIVRLPRRLD